MVKEKKSKEGERVEPDENIVNGRDPEMVVDLLKVKIKYAKRAEEAARIEYEKGKRTIEEKMEKGTRKWRKMMKQIQNYTNKTWNELNETNNEKVEKLVKKYNVKTVRKKTKEEEEEEALIVGILIKDEELREMIKEEGEI